MYSSDEQLNDIASPEAEQPEPVSSSADRQDVAANATLQLIQTLQQGFNPPTVSSTSPSPSQPRTSTLAQGAAIEYAQMVDLEGGEGSIIYYPPQVQDLEIGDVLYLREIEEPQGENGIIVQVIEKGTVSYPQAATKSLFRLMASVRAHQLQRYHNEPTETIDQFLSLQFKVRATIDNSQWRAQDGQVVTRNVDIFRIQPSILIQNVVATESVV